MGVCVANDVYDSRAGEGRVQSDVVRRLFVVFCLVGWGRVRSEDEVDDGVVVVSHGC